MQITISGVNESVVDAYDELAEQYGLYRSEAMRPALRKYLEDRDDLPEYAKKDAAFEQLTKENTWKMRVMWFESNVREFFNDCLSRDISPSPERVEWAFVQSAHKEVVEQAPEEFTDEMAEYVEEEFARYEALYFAENPEEADHNPRRTEQLVGYCSGLWEAGQKDVVTTYVKALSEQGNMPTGIGTDELISQVRSEASDDWKASTCLSADTPQRSQL